MSSLGIFFIKQFDIKNHWCKVKDNGNNNAESDYWHLSISRHCLLFSSATAQRYRAHSYTAIRWLEQQQQLLFLIANVHSSRSKMVKFALGSTTIVCVVAVCVLCTQSLASLVTFWNGPVFFCSFRLLVGGVGKRKQNKNEPSNRKRRERHQTNANS